MNETLTDKLTEKVEKYLKRMDTWLGWQVGFVFEYFRNKAGFELNKLEVAEYPSYAPDHYDRLRMRYDAMVKQAKSERLIEGVG